jgi:hypothetical protein
LRIGGSVPFFCLSQSFNATAQDNFYQVRLLPAQAPANTEAAYKRVACTDNMTFVNLHM